MLRINIAALTWASERYWYLDNLFSGVAYIIDGISISHVVDIVDGVRCGDHISPYLPGDLTFPRVDLTGFTEDEICDLESYERRHDAGFSYDTVRLRYRLLLNGHAFTGIVYEFLTVFCTHEIGYRDGFIVSDANWDRSGQLRGLEFERDIDECHPWYPAGRVDECYGWHADGRSSGGWINFYQAPAESWKDLLLSCSMAFTDAGNISYVNMEGDQASLDSLISKHVYFPLKKISEIADYEAAERFLMYDDDFGYELFAGMIRNDAFRSTVELMLHTKFLKVEEGFEYVTNLRALRKVSVRSEDDTAVDTARRIKNRRPDLEVLYSCRSTDYPAQFEDVEID